MANIELLSPFFSGIAGSLTLLAMTAKGIVIANPQGEAICVFREIAASLTLPATENSLQGCGFTDRSPPVVPQGRYGNNARVTSVSGTHKV